MEGISPMFIIEEEHKLVVRGLGVLEAASAKLIKQSLPKEFWEGVMDFLKNFVDKAHHTKEEMYFLPNIQRYNSHIEAWCELILKEHKKSQDLTAEIEAHYKALGHEPEAVLKLIKAIKEYIKQSSAHTAKEEHMFPKLTMPFPRGLMERIYHGFMEVDKEAVGGNALDRYRELMQRLEAFVE